MKYTVDQFGFLSGFISASVGASIGVDTPPPEPTGKLKPKWSGSAWVLERDFRDVTWYNQVTKSYETSTDPFDDRGFPWIEVEGGAITNTLPTSPNQVFNYVTKEWEDPRTLADFKAAKWADIKQARDTAEFGGFVWDGSTFDSDAISQQRIQGLVHIANLDPAMTVQWTLANNTTRTLSSADAVQVGLALAAHVNGAHMTARVLREAIEAATTPEQVQAITWPQP